jgi:solute carrier family 41
MLAHVIIHAMWRFKIDPDTASIPYLTAFGDLIGSSLLFAAFSFLEAIGHGYEGRVNSSVLQYFTDPFDDLLNFFIDK